MNGRSRHLGINFRVCISVALFGLVAVGAHAADVVVSIDRTTLDWSDLGMGAPTAADDADRNQNPRAVFSYVPSYGKPHAEAGARELKLPRLNDGKLPRNGDDNANNTWFDTAENSRILVDLGKSTNIARINVYSWHSGALSPQQYTLWATDRNAPANAKSADLANDWQEIAKVDTHSLGEGGKHGSSINGKQDAGGYGAIGKYRYLLFDVPANRPDWSRSGFISEIDVYQVGRELEKVKVVSRERRTGSQTLKFGDIHLTKPLTEATPFLLSGPKLYEYAAMDGTFPQVGRLDGDQGGVWCHPIKLLNSFKFAILEEGQNDLRLQGPDSHFTHELASCKFNFSRNDLKITRRDFVPEDESALFSLLTLRNETDQARVLNVQLTASVNIRPSYESRLPNGLDVVSYKDGLVSAFDSDMASKWGVVFGCDKKPARHRIDGSNAVLTYAVTLPAQGETTLRLLILGEHETGVDTARRRFESVHGEAAEMLTRKQSVYADRILGGVKFDCSDKRINDAFYCAKANVMMSVMELPDYPAPFLAAGFPIYTWLFGCDSLYSTPGVAAGGFDEAAGDTLDCLLHFAAQKKQGAHEVASNGRLLGWDHIQETPQLVLACWKHFQWTGDMSFLRKAYPVCEESVAHVLATADRDNDGYLEGPGLMEQSGMGPERIASACYLYAAFESLAEMTQTLGEKSRSADYRRRAAEFKKNFNKDWWNREEDMWACSLRDDHTQTMDDFWAVCFPQEVGLADIDKAEVALARIQKEWVNDSWGFVAQRKSNITTEGVGVVHNNVLAQTAFKYGKTDLGWKLIKLSAKAPLEARMLGAFDETMPGGGDLMQLWSFGPFLEAIVGGLVGVHPAASEHRVEIYPQFPTELTHYALQDVEFGGHKLNVNWKRDGEENLVSFAHTQGPADLLVTLRVAMNDKSPIKLNGKLIDPEIEELNGVTTRKVEVSLPLGASATVRFDSDKGP